MNHCRNVVTDSETAAHLGLENDRPTFLSTARGWLSKLFIISQFHYLEKITDSPIRNGKNKTNGPKNGCKIIRSSYDHGICQFAPKKKLGPWLACCRFSTFLQISGMFITFILMALRQIIPHRNRYNQVKQLTGP
jgi:hypothetical protein